MPTASPSGRRKTKVRGRGSRGCDHNVRRLDDGNGVVADLQAELVDGFVGDRRRDDDAIGDGDPDMRGRRAAADFHDLAVDLIAGAELHGGLLAGRVMDPERYIPPDISGS